MNLTTKRCKLLPLTNPNFTMLNSFDSLKEMLGNVPIVSDDLSMPHKSETVIGAVSPINNYTLENNFICGDCIFYDNDKEYEWVNAEAEVDYKSSNEGGYVTSIKSIQMKEIQK